MHVNVCTMNIYKVKTDQLDHAKVMSDWPVSLFSNHLPDKGLATRNPIVQEFLQICFNKVNRLKKSIVVPGFFSMEQ